MKQEFKILLLESANCSAELVEFELSLAQARFKLERVADLDSYFRALKEYNPHLIMADRQVPLPDGLMALALAREICPEVPFLYLAGDMRPPTKKTGDPASAQNNPRMMSRTSRTKGFWYQRTPKPSLDQ
jgi:DNA-binding response OmpR family regulator